MDKFSKIYIAGHRGMVGSAIQRALSERGYTNIVVKTHKELDLTRQKDTEDFFQREQPDYVFIAAARVGGIYANSTYTAEFIYQNIMIAGNIIHASYKFDVKKLLNLGSTCIYPKLAPQPMKEEHLLTGSLEPTNEPYAIAKIAAIKMCRYFNEQYGTNFLSCMPTNMYGLNDNFDLMTSHFLPAFIRKFHLAKLLKAGDYDGIKVDFTNHCSPTDVFVDQITQEQIDSVLRELGILKDRLRLWGTGSPYREFLYADDLADACLFLMTRYDARDIGEMVNIGTGRDMPIKEYAGLVKDIVAYDGLVEWDTSKPDGTPRKLSDTSRMKALGWEPGVGLDEGIKRVYDQYAGL
ncbi:MAG: GDP-L-fucose synthase [Candidatus Omnitrophica bacterium]|nr:GDP-L-fucose synthase [Candidatus Omnitrophota bacterium]